MFAGLLTLLTLAVLVVLAAYAVHRLTSVEAGILHALPSQSGFVPQEHALSRYHARWYLATLVFLAFDVEMLFMYPWAAVVADLGTTAVVEMFLFLAGLFVAVVWAWREGALRWA